MINQQELEDYIQTHILTHGWVSASDHDATGELEGYDLCIECDCVRKADSLEWGVM